MKQERMLTEDQILEGPSLSEVQSLTVKTVEMMAAPGYYHFNKNFTLSTQFAWRESIDLSETTLCAPCVDGAQFGLS